MNGVEILATEQVAVAFGFGWTLFFMLGLLFITLFGAIGWGLAKEKGLSGLGTGVSICVGIILALVLAALIGGFSETGAPTEFETHHKIIISDEVSANEFLKHYEVIDQDGKIYVVREVE